MKTLLVTIKDPAKGDLVVVEYACDRGGCTHVKYQIIGAHQRARVNGDGIVEGLDDVPAETPRAIAAIIAGKINKEWMPEAFEAGVVESTGALKIHCTGLVQDVRFRASVAGSGGTTVDLMEL